MKTQKFFYCVAAVLVLASTAQADRRAYVWTYEYVTMPQGQAEIEYYSTVKAPDFTDFSDTHTWEHQAEFEYGLTDHWDVSIYQQWTQTHSPGDDSFEYTGHKLETRYRFAEKGVLPVDILAYMEYSRPDGSKPNDALEAKLILAKDIGKFNVAYNQIVERHLRNERKPEHEYAMGVSYEFDPSFKIGMESTGSFSEGEYYLGPTISLASEKLWVAIGAISGLNDHTDDFRIRLIAGIPLN